MESNRGPSKEYETIITKILDYQYLEHKSKLVYVLKVLGAYIEPVPKAAIIKSLRISSSTDDVLHNLTPFIKNNNKYAEVHQLNYIET